MAITLYGESRAPTTVNLSWTGAAGGFNIAVKRSASGCGSFTTIATVATGTTTYEDTGRTEGTVYCYKLTENSVDSNNVSIQTQSCTPAAGDMNALGLPRAGDTDALAAKFDEAMEQLEVLQQNRLYASSECKVCSTNGAIQINCSESCQHFYVEMTEDITSISINFCDETTENLIEFLVPPSTTYKVCGWPTGFGFEGDECKDFDIAGGSTGRSYQVPFSGSSGRGPAASGPAGSSRKGTGGAGSGGGSGSATANCGCSTAEGGTLTLLCCTTNCSMNCGSTKKLTMQACGGTPPYTWSITGTGDVTGSSGSGSTAIVTPPENSGSAVAGNAYELANTEIGCVAGGACPCIENCSTCPAGPNCCKKSQDWGATWGCADQQTIAWGGSPSGCGSLPTWKGGPGAVDCCTASATFQGGLTSSIRYGSATDIRSGSMISAGCNPCGLTMSNQVVTVTDNNGNMASKTISG